MKVTETRQKVRRIAGGGLRARANAALQRFSSHAPEGEPTPDDPASQSATTPDEAAAPAEAPQPYVGPPLVRDFAVEAQGATAALIGRLRPEDVEATELAIAAEPELQALYRSVAWPDRNRALLHLALHLGVDAVAERTGLPTAQPPETVHAMARGPLAAAGGLYEADLVVDALASAGVDVGSVRRALDFGCSSGRALRVLSNAFPGTDWQGCDPNTDAIAWASEAIPTARFFVSGNRPPLDLPDGSLDLAFAISIWSHFAPELGLLWLEEMRRLIEPGGHLVLTTHGTTTIQHDAIHGVRSVEQLNDARWAVVTQGSWYADEFGEEGDWGVVNPEWGTAFLSAEWLLAYACPRWRLLEFAPGRNAGNQDVYVLERA
jgi:SAM-dependent methyltransferase